MLKRRPEYFVVFALSAIAAVGSAGLMLAALDTGTPSLSGNRNESAMQMVSRASDLIGVSTEDKITAGMSVRYGTYSAGDYVLSVMTSPDYLIKSPDDDQFAKDLCNVVYGNASDPVITEIKQQLGSNNRMTVINNVISQSDRIFAVSGETRAGPGSVITGIDLEKGLEGDSDYTVGIKEISVTIARRIS